MMILPSCAQTCDKFSANETACGPQYTYIDWNRGEFMCAGESGERENSVYGDMVDIIEFPGEEIRGFSNAIAAAETLTCVNA